MKHSILLVLCTGALLIVPRLSHGSDYSGQWLGTITESINRCENLGKAKPGDYKLTITHQGNDISIVENVVKRPYTGVFNPKRPQFAHVQGTYVDDGGYVSEQVNIEFADDNGGRGESSWRWSDGYYACGGKFVFNLKKIQPR